MSFNEINDIWTAGNNSGEGYGIGGDDDGLNGAIRAEGWTIFREGDSDDDVWIAKTKRGYLVLVADANGPWAVGRDGDLEATLFIRLALGDLSADDVARALGVADDAELVALARRYGVELGEGVMPVEVP